MKFFKYFRDMYQKIRRESLPSEIVQAEKYDSDCAIKFLNCQKFQMRRGLAFLEYIRNNYNNPDLFTLVTYPQFCATAKKAQDVYQIYRHNRTKNHFICCFEKKDEDSTFDLETIAFISSCNIGHFCSSWYQIGNFINKKCPAVVYSSEEEFEQVWSSPFVGPYRYVHEPENEFYKFLKQNYRDRNLFRKLGETKDWFDWGDDHTYTELFESVITHKKYSFTYSLNMGGLTTIRYVRNDKTFSLLKEYLCNRGDIWIDFNESNAIEYSTVAQLVEQFPVKEKVGGS